MIAYLDTSAAFKVVVREAGTDHVLGIVDEAASLVSSLLLYAEGHAALARATRDARLSAATLRQGTHAFEALWAKVFRVGLDLTIARAAAALARSEQLRACDAVHLAAALAIADDDLVLVAADGPLCDAASRTGLNVARIALA